MPRLVCLLGILLATLTSEGAAMSFRPVPLFGADVRSLVFDPSEPDRAFAGTSGGHVYRSDDGGESWRNAGAEVPFPGWVVGALLFDPNRPDRLWAGMWGIWGGGLVAFSEDRGGSWTVRTGGLLEGDQVYALALVPGAPDRLFAGTRSGVWGSEDAGESWRLLTAGVADLVHVSSLLVDGSAPHSVIAGTWRRAYRSDDGGVTWRGIFEGMVLDTEVFTMRPVPGRAGELWASTCGWVYRGEGLGGRWTRTKAGFEERRVPSFDVLSPERLLAGTVAGLHLSTDAGASFRRVGPKDLAVLALAHHPARPERVLIGTEGAGVWLSRDGGETLSARPVAKINIRVPALAAAGDLVFAAVAHAGPLSGVYRSPDGGVSFEPQPARLPTVLDLAAHEGRLFAATERGLFERTGAEWRQVAELGESRVEQLAAGDGRLVVRARDGISELVAGRFVRRADRGATPRSVALAQGALWLLGSEGLRRVGGDGATAASSLPFPGGAITAAGGALVYSGAGGLYLHEPARGWVELARERARAVGTGHRRFPAVVQSGNGLFLIDRELARLVPLGSPFAAIELLSAVAVGDRLLVGSSGYGLWETALAD